MTAIGQALLVEESRGSDTDGNNNQQADAAANVSSYYEAQSIGYIITSLPSGVLLSYLTKQEVFLLCMISPIIVLLLSFKMVEDVRVDDQDSRSQKILHPLLFMFIITIYPSSDVCMQYFFTNVLDFSSDFLGLISLFINISSYVGILIYDKYLSEVKFETIFMSTTILGSAIGLSQLIVVTRENLKWGIPNKAFIFGHSFASNVLYEINQMPLLTLTSQLCPKKIEGTMYSLVMSSFNLSTMISGFLGALMTDYLNITQTNFNNLWILIFFANIATLITLPFLFLVDFNAATKIAEQDIDYGELDEKIQTQ